MSVPFDFQVNYIKRMNPLPKRGTHSRFDLDGLLHSYDDKPALILPDGTKIWYKHGLKHRDDTKPAFIHPLRTETMVYIICKWYQNGKLQNDRLHNGSNYVTSEYYEMNGHAMF